MKNLIIDSLIKNSVGINEECVSTLNATLNEKLKEKGLGTLDDPNFGSGHTDDEIGDDVIDLAFKIAVLDNLRTILMAIKIKGEK